MNIYVTGHKSPDLDSITSAIVYSELLRKIKKYPGSNIIPVRRGALNKETEFVLEKFDVKVPEDLETVEISSEDSFILVDHNEETQRPKKIGEQKILEIVDHHKVNINFGVPLEVNVMPVGSTSTIVFSLYKRENLKPSKKHKNLLLAAILSDTQGLKSSTTTGLDSEYAHELAELTDTDINELTFEIFKAKSDLRGLTTAELVKKDYKVFDFGGNKVFINQIETVEPDSILDQKDSVIEQLEEVKSELGASLGYVMVTDILNVNSRVIYSNEEEKRILEEAFTAEGEKGIVDIGPKMSRKKDIAPKIEKVLIK